MARGNSGRLAREALRLEEGRIFLAIRRRLENPRTLMEGIGALLVAYSGEAFRRQALGPIRWKTRAETKMVPNWPGLIRDAASGRTTPPPERFLPGPVLQDKGDLARSIASQVVSDDTVEVGVTGPAKAYGDALHSGKPTLTDTLTRGVQKKLAEWIRGAAKRIRSRVDVRAARKAREALSSALARVAKLKGGGTTGPRLAKARAAVDVARKAVQETRAVKRSRSGPPTAKEARDTGLAKVGWLLNKKMTGRRLSVKHPARPFVGVPPTLLKDVERLFLDGVVR